ncbi:hypothetical protein GF412_02670 [Candidatus Micrarchaeota archaeon]|nr:hypothetical protein [Candidatus Micrarchaeota archaeon]MBD3417862.1 hypothetical protein [Candidatus Micrarchaeota archaeon]
MVKIYRASVVQLSQNGNTLKSGGRLDCVSRSKILLSFVFFSLIVSPASAVASPGCSNFYADARSLQIAEISYFMDWNEYSCDLSGYMSFSHTDADQWECITADDSTYQWKFTSDHNEVYYVDPAFTFSCDNRQLCNSSGFDGATTNTSSIVHTPSFSNLTLESTGSGKIFWPGPLNLSGLTLSDIVTISDNFVEVKTDTYGNLDSPANISIYGLTYDEMPVIYRNGAICTSPVCTFISYSSGTYTFGVTGFSNYTAGPNAALGVWDENDPEGGSKGRGPGDNVTFYANYTNVTSGQPITAGASCNITFDEAPPGPASMNYDAATQLWNYTRNFSGLSINWEVTCSGTGYETLNLTDTLPLGVSSSPNGTAELNGANTTFISSSKYTPGISAGQATIEGGNISGTNLDSNASTERWAGFYGNVTGELVLAEAANSAFMHKWQWSPSNGGEICISINSSLSLFFIAAATGAEIDSAWSFSPSVSDSGTNTFNLTNCSMNIGGADLHGADYADTGPAGGFSTCVFKTVSGSPAKNDMLFCVNITNGTLFNGLQGNYEVMAPTNAAPNSYETYYFYANLN